MWAAAFQAARETDKKSEEDTGVNNFLETCGSLRGTDEDYESMKLAKFVKDFIVGHANAAPSSGTTADSIGTTAGSGSVTEDKICHPFMNTGACKFGNRCRYLHKTRDEATEGDMVAIQRVVGLGLGRAATGTASGSGTGAGALESDSSICYPFLHYGKCKFGGRCRYIHKTRDGAVVGTGNGATATPEASAAATSAVASAPAAPADDTCYPFLMFGWCKHGKRCKYVHRSKPKAEEEASMAVSDGGTNTNDDSEGTLPAPAPIVALSESSSVKASEQPQKQKREGPDDGEDDGDGGEKTEAGAGEGSRKKPRTEKKEKKEKKDKKEKKEKKDKKDKKEKKGKKDIV